VRYEARAYGTREEIIETLRNNLGAHRSDRRQREAQEAIDVIEAGASEVQYGPTLYIVEDESSVPRPDQPSC
jgi:hypothetical protein